MKRGNFDMLENLPETSRLMIKACLEPDGEAREKIVRDWEKCATIDDMPYTEMRLVPLFFLKNERAGITTRYDKRLKIIYKFWWLKTNHILDQLKKVCKLFFEQGIETILIKGSSMVSYYERPELRPMADFDLLIHPADIDKALNILCGIGYVPEEPRGTLYNKNPALLTTFRHALKCIQDVTKTEADLHWRIGSVCSLQLTESLWQHAVDHTLVPFSKRSQLAYEIFLAIIHAVQSMGKDNLNWIIDIAMLDVSPDVWNEARNIALGEKKEALFDWGCHILVKNGVNAPGLLNATRPKLHPYATHQNRTGMSTLRRIALWFDEYLFYLKYFLPHTNRAGKVSRGLQHFTQFVRFKISTWQVEKARAARSGKS